jgi:hypothetical protein
MVRVRVRVGARVRVRLGFVTISSGGNVSKLFPFRDS